MRQHQTTDVEIGSGRHLRTERHSSKGNRGKTVPFRTFKKTDQEGYCHPATDGGNGTFSLEDERPLANMAAPETLADFIRWGTENYPAKKFALVLWDHGGGSATGIFIDELFDGEYMTLDLLNKALHDGGAHFEAVLFDACMMASLETACAIRQYANWMIASEELVAGKGTAIGEWLQELYYVPKLDGRLLGRRICDTAMIKYADSSDTQAQDLMMGKESPDMIVPQIMQDIFPAE